MSCCPLDMSSGTATEDAFQIFFWKYFPKLLVLDIPLF